MPIPGLEKSSRRARSLSSCSEPAARFFRSSDEGFAVTEPELLQRATRRGSLGEGMEIEGLVLNSVKMGREREKRRKQRGRKEREDAAAVNSIVFALRERERERGRESCGCGKRRLIIYETTSFSLDMVDTSDAPFGPVICATGTDREKQIPRTDGLGSVSCLINMIRITHFIQNILCKLKF